METTHGQESGIAWTNDRTEQSRRVSAAVSQAFARGKIGRMQATALQRNYHTGTMNYEQVIAILGR